MSAAGRQHHDVKVTVYMSREEFAALEQARVDLCSRWGIRIDRGRLVREALHAFSLARVVERLIEREDA